MLCSGGSEPQLKAIAGEVQTRLREEDGVRPQAVDGFPASQWVVVDYGDVLVHIFAAEKRSYYALEDLWNDAPRVTWAESESPVTAATTTGQP